MYGELDRFLVPLDAPLARRYFNDALFAPHSLVDRLRRATGRPRLRKTSDTSGIRPLLDRLGGDFRYEAAIFLRDYATSERGRVVGFFFRKGEAMPFAVAKSDSTSLNAEAQALEQMRAFLPPALKTTLPRVLQSNDHLLVTTAMPGRTAYMDLQGSLMPWRSVDAHFEAAAKWLAAFHDATRTRATSVIDGIEVPHSAMHGDFWPRNVMHDAGGNIAVVDWEHFQSSASPFIDLFHYPLAYGMSYPFHRGYRFPGEEEAFRKTFVENTRVSRAVRRYLRTYATLAGLPEKVLQPAFRKYLETHGRMHAGVEERPGTATLPWEKFRSAGVSAG